MRWVFYSYFRLREVIIVQGENTEDVEEWIEFHTHKFHEDFFVHTVTVTRSKGEDGRNHYVGTIVFHRRDKEED
ncbi:hypothetical protein ABFG93_00400 [Pseudalkalibacillus hwajinpoensis]|uniref:hypothetical protein n=1 Tax=Guptibacillus hwajinpoensis TaxID=208199 RepID=UPI00325BCEDB